MHADRVNRTALVLLGLLLALAGAAGLLTALGVFSDDLTEQPVFDNFVSDYIGDSGAWLWPVVAVVGGLLTLLCLRWIFVLLASTDRAGTMTVPGDRRAGRTTVLPAALTRAVVDELETYRGVESAKARLVGDADLPDLVLEVTAARSVDIGALRRRIEHEAIAHARTVLDRPDLPVRLDLDVGRRIADRVG